MDVGSIAKMVNAAHQGSPQILHAAGRVFGLGEAERNAIRNGDFPRWALALVGAAGGFMLGVYAHNRWPKQTGKLIGT